MARLLAVVLLACLGAAAARAASDVVTSFSDLGGKPYSVSYNERSILVGGKKVLLLSGSVHYVRSTPAMWPSIFAKMKASGLNAVESYVFWNYHVTALNRTSTPDYTGRGNVTLFLELAAKADLFVLWRIGPYVCAEWPGGGMPSWLNQVKDPRGKMHARSATQPYQDVCRDWMVQHIELVKPFFAQNGGPIIMTQIENELSGSSDTPYVQWLGTLVKQLDTGLPWIMCHGAHANDTIETYNGCDGTSFVDGQVAQGLPAMWSEDEQWFDRFTQGASVRSTTDLGRGVAAWVAAGGSMHNFYMFHGGTMWGNWSTTVRRTRLTPSYANSANLASDSIIYDPKYSNIALLHHVLTAHAATILHTPVPIALTSISKSTWSVTLNGTAQDAPLSFLFNDDAAQAASVSFHGKTHAMAPRSAMIFDADDTRLWYSEPGVLDDQGQPYLPALAAGTSLKWESWSDAEAGQGEDGAGADPEGGATWYRTSFARPVLPQGAQLSLNLTGFGQGNVFLNGVHVVYFNLENGECFHAPGGVNFHGSCLSYIKSRCDKPTQDCYHVPPEWLQEQNTMLVYSDSRLPANVTAIHPELAQVVYRVDPPNATWRQFLRL